VHSWFSAQAIFMATTQYYIGAHLQLNVEAEPVVNSPNPDGTAQPRAALLRRRLGAMWIRSRR
jgi:hypothetical protein